MQRFKTRIKIFPNMILAKQLRKLFSGKMLCRFVLLGTEYYKLSLSTHQLSLVRE